MIQINLLPEELRPLEKTPLSRFIVIIAGAALATTALFIFLVLQFKTLPEARQRKADTEKDVQQKKILAAEYDKLEAEIEFFNLRIRTVQQIKQERFIWSKKLFELHRVIESAPDIALKNISIEKGRAVNPMLGGATMKIVMDAYSVVPEISSVADFMTKIRTSEFYKGCENVKPKGIVVKDKPDGAICEFTLEITLEPQQVPQRGGGR